jgi:hypothetical protein
MIPAIPRAKLDEVLQRYAEYLAPPQDPLTRSYVIQPGFLPVLRDDRPDARLGERDRKGWRRLACARPSPVLQKILDQCRSPRPWSLEIVTRQDGTALFLRDAAGGLVLLTVEAPH